MIFNNNNNDKIIMSPNNIFIHSFIHVVVVVVLADEFLKDELPKVAVAVAVAANVRCYKYLFKLVDFYHFFF